MLAPSSLRIITVIAFIVLLGMGIRKPVWAVIAYTILVYCKISSYYPAFAAMEAELLFGLLILLRVFLSGEFAVKLSPRYDILNKYLLFFALSMFLSFIFSLDMQRSWDNAFYHFIKILLLYIIILVAIQTEQDLKIFIWGFVIMFAYLAYEPAFGFLTGTGASPQMYGDVYVAEKGPLSGHVALANNMNQMIPICFFLIQSIKKRTFRILGLIPLLIFLIALIASKSRGGVLGLMIVAVTLGYFSKNRIRNLAAVGIAAIMLFGLSGDLKFTASRMNMRSVKGRLLGFAHGIEMVRVWGHILGVGPGCFAFARGKYFGHRFESHNIYGELIGDLGIPGTIAWFFFIRQIFLNLMKSKKKLKDLSMENGFLYRLAMGIQASLIVRLFVSLASHGLYYFYWYVMGALSIMILKLAGEQEYCLRNT